MRHSLSISGKNNKILPMGPGSNTSPGPKFREAPKSFFKKMLTKKFRRLSNQGADEAIAEIESAKEQGESGWSKIRRQLSTIRTKLPIRHLKIIRPDAKRKKHWVRFIMLATVYSVILNPIQIAFDLKATDLALIVIDCVCDACFMADIYVVLRTAVVLDNKFLKKPNQILNYHFKSYNFYLDALSSFPTGFVQLINKSNAWRSVRILKVLRLSKVGRILKEFSPDKFNTSDQQRLMILLFYLLVATHLLACAFIMICRLNDWPSHFFIPGVDPDDLYQTYSGSICWALMSLTGIGAILTPITVDENIFVLVTILVGIFVYAIILGNVYSVLANYQYLETAYLRKVSSVLEFCKYRGVPDATQRKVTMYYRLMWSRNKGIQDSLLLEDMTKPLRQEILMHSFKNIYNRCKWVKDMSEHHKKLLAEHLRNEIYMPREVVVNSGESPHSILFVARGCMGVLANASSDEKSRGQELVGTLKDGCVYGVYHVAKNFLHNATLKTQTFVEVAVMFATDYLELRRVIPELQTLEDSHLEKEIGDIIPNLKKKRQVKPGASRDKGGPPSATFNLGRKIEKDRHRPNRRDSLANKLLGIIGNAVKQQKAIEDKEDLVLIDRKGTAGTTDELFKANQDDQSEAED